MNFIPQLFLILHSRRKKSFIFTLVNLLTYELIVINEHSNTALTNFFYN